MVIGTGVVLSNLICSVFQRIPAVMAFDNALAFAAWLRNESILIHEAVEVGPALDNLQIAEIPQILVL
nr:hypothetical protein [uncultured Methanobrevibacter sp.]